jgi:hypothetical protein
MATGLAVFDWGAQFMIDRRLLFWLLGTVSLLVSRGALATDTTWTFNGDGNWTDAAKWSNGEPNSNLFNVFIDDGDTPVTVTLGTTRTIGTLALGSDDTLTLQTTTSATQTLTASAGFVNDGSIQLTSTSSGTAALALTTGALTNSSTGILNFQAGGTGSRTFGGDLVNNGTVTVARATSFNKSGGQYTNNNQFTVGTGNTLTVSGSGAFEQAGGTLNVQGTYSQTGGAFKYSGGTINGTVGLVGGTLAIASGGTNPASFQVDGTSTLSLLANVVSSGQVLTLRSTTSSATITSANGFANNGSIYLTGTGGGQTFLTLTTGTLVNNPTGLLAFQTGGSQSRAFTGDLTNQGGTVQIDRDTSFSKTGGLFRQTSGTTNINTGVNSALTLSNGSSIVIDGGAFNMNGEIDLGTVTQNGGTLTSTYTLFADTNYKYLGGSITGGPITFFGGGLTIGAAATSPAAFRFFLSNTLTLGGNKLRSGQSILIDGNGPSTVTSANGFTNESVITIQNSSSSGSPTASTLAVTSGSLTNAANGLLDFKATSHFSANVLDAGLENYGNVLVEHSATFSKASVFYRNFGTVSVFSGAELNMNSTSTYQQVSGITQVDGTISGGATLQLLAGRLRGSGTIVSPVAVTSASVEPGSGVGTLAIQGGYSQAASGSLNVELSGTAANQFDVLAVTGSATLAGTLNVGLVGGFAPQVGQQFTVLTATSVVNNNGLTLGGGAANAFSLIVNSNSVVLKVINAGTAGDYNFDGAVNAADYVLWRKNDGSPAGYDAWRANFGRTAAIGTSSLTPEVVPEPRTAFLGLVGLGFVLAHSRRLRTLSREREL